jgi:hypothetical protein
MTLLDRVQAAQFGGASPTLPAVRVSEAIELAAVASELVQGPSVVSTTR